MLLISHRMKDITLNFANVNDALKQLRKLPASKETIKVLDCVCVILGTSRHQVAEAIDPRPSPVVIKWAFEQGKSPRAKQVRRQCVGVLKKLAKDHHPDIPDFVDEDPDECDCQKAVDPSQN